MKRFTSALLAVYIVLSVSVTSSAKGTTVPASVNSYIPYSDDNGYVYMAKLYLDFDIVSVYNGTVNKIVCSTKTITHIVK